MQCDSSDWLEYDSDGWTEDGCSSDGIITVYMEATFGQWTA